MVIDYKKEKIEFYESEGCWKFTSDGVCLCSNPNIKSVKSFIDRWKKTKFKRFEILVDCYSDLYSATVTSIDASGNYWATSEERGREKIYAGYAYLMTEKNKKLFKIIRAYQDRVKELEGKIEKETDKLEKVKIEGE